MRRSYPIRTHLLCMLPLVLLLCLLWTTLGNDAQITLFFMQYRAEHPEYTRWVQWFTDGVNPAFYLVYGCLLWRGARRNRPDLAYLAVAYILAQVLVTMLLGLLIKIVVGRPRPMVGGAFTPLTLKPGHHSFASGHTAEITGACLPLALRSRQTLLSLGLGVVIALTTFSRIYLSLHHLTDLVGGMALGSLAGYLAWLWTPLIPSWLNHIKPFASRFPKGDV